MRKVVAGLLLGGGSALIVFLLAWTKLGGLDRIDLQLYDWSLRRLADPGAVRHAGGETLAIARGTHPAHEITVFDANAGPQMIAMAKDIIRKCKEVPANVG